MADETPSLKRPATLANIMATRPWDVPMDWRDFVVIGFTLKGVIHLGYAERFVLQGGVFRFYNGGVEITDTVASGRGAVAVSKYPLGVEATHRAWIVQDGFRFPRVGDAPLLFDYLEVRAKIIGRG